jgi:hypothetical protein
LATTEAGTLKYLVNDDGDYTAGLYYYDGSNFQKVVSSSDVSSLYPPVTLIEGQGISFIWDEANHTLTISTE